jgi:type I restriction enzyme S subunit
MGLGIEKYKQTEAGVIPIDWEVDSIKNLALISTGAKNTQDRVEDGLFPFFVRSQNVERINSYSYDGEAVLTAGDGVGTGKVFHYINGKFDFHQRVYKISDFKERLNGYFFYLYFSNFFLPRIMSMTAKSSVDSVRMDMIADMRIPLPPISEQTAIATALSNVDALIESLDRIISKKINIRLGAMHDLLYGKKRLSGFNGKWNTRLIGDILKIKHGRSQKEVECETGTYPILGSGGIIGYANNYIYDNQSVLIGRKGTIDKPRFMDSPFWTVDTLFYSEIKPQYFPKYIYYIFLLIDWYSYNEASGVPSLNAKTIENIEVTVPLYEEQQAIAAILTDMDFEIEELNRKQFKYGMIKRGMMQALLTGKIRLL